MGMGKESRTTTASKCAAVTLAVPNDEALQTAVEAAQACVASHRLGPFAAARAFLLARRALAPNFQRGGGKLLAAGLADAVLARKLNWPFVLPLLAAPAFSRAGRRAAGEEGAESARVLFAYAQAAERACDLAADLQRRARALAEAAPKLRAKGARVALNALLDEDSLNAARKIPGLSERGARRLFDRLVELGVVRALTGRASFRLYGL